MNKDNKLSPTPEYRQLALGMASYAGASIFGPLVVFGAIGFALDNYFESKPLFIIISVLVAFVITNIFLFKKVKKLNKDFYSVNHRDDDPEENDDDPDEDE